MLKERQEQRITKLLEENFFSEAEIQSILDTLNKASKVKKKLFHLLSKEKIFFLSFVSGFLVFFLLEHLTNISYKIFLHDNPLFFARNAIENAFTAMFMAYPVAFYIPKFFIYCITGLRRYELCNNLISIKVGKAVIENKRKNSKKITKEDFKKKTLEQKLFYLYWELSSLKKIMLPYTAFALIFLVANLIYIKHSYYVVFNDRILSKNLFEKESIFFFKDITSIETMCYTGHRSRTNVSYRIKFPDREFVLLRDTSPVLDNLSGIKLINSTVKRYGIQPKSAVAEPKCLEKLKDHRLYGNDSHEFIKEMFFYN